MWEELFREREMEEIRSGADLERPRQEAGAGRSQQNIAASTDLR